MDELKITSKLMLGIIGFTLRNVIYKNTGVKIELTINSINANFKNGKASIHLDVDGELDESELRTLARKMQLPL